MKKRTIVIASILKPVTDTRMFEKFAQSIVNNTECEVIILGNQISNKPVHTHIRFISINVQNRIGYERFFAPFKHFFILLKIKPSLLIITTHELLWLVIALKLMRKVKVIYDVRENYYLNIRYTDTYPAPIQFLLASYVRIKEKICSSLISHFILAESSYASELSFIADRYSVVENKSNIVGNRAHNPNNDKIKIIFTGTIASSTGIFEAIELAIKLHAVNSKIHLVIIGYCAQASTLNQVKERIKGFEFIQLIGGDHLVPHDQIMEQVLIADFGVIHYPDSPHVKGRIPTKYYEYLAHHLPVLIQKESDLFHKANQFGACIGVDFKNPDTDQIAYQMTNTTFYSSSTACVTWEEEESKLIAVIKKVL